MSGVDKIAAERATHEARGYAAAHDDQFIDEELAKASMCYASPGLPRWPWNRDDAPQRVGNIERRIEQLAKAGALIAAEIDRLERFAGNQQAPKQEEPQEYILIIPGQEPSGDESPHGMHLDSANVLNYLLKETGDKRRWLPTAEILGEPEATLAEFPEPRLDGPPFDY